MHNFVTGNVTSHCVRKYLCQFKHLVLINETAYSIHVNCLVYTTTVKTYTTIARPNHRVVVSLSTFQTSMQHKQDVLYSHFNCLTMHCISTYVFVLKRLEFRTNCVSLKTILACILNLTVNSIHKMT